MQTVKAKNRRANCKAKISAVQNARRIPLTQTSLFCGRRTFPPALKIFLIITDIRVYPKHPFLPSALLLFCASLRRMAAGVVKFLGNLQKNQLWKFYFLSPPQTDCIRGVSFAVKFAAHLKSPTIKAFYFAKNFFAYPYLRTSQAIAWTFGKIKEGEFIFPPCVYCMPMHKFRIPSFRLNLFL